MSVLSENFIPATHLGSPSKREFLPSSSIVNYCKTALKRDEKHSAALNIISCAAALTKVSSSSYSCNIIIHGAFRANFKRFVCPCGISREFREGKSGCLSLPPEIHEKAAINEIYIVLLSNRVIELSTK